VIVGLVREDLRPSAIMTRAAFENAIRVNAAIGGSTNAVIHLLAWPGAWACRCRLTTSTCWPGCAHAGEPAAERRILMEDFCYAGGLPA